MNEKKPAETKKIFIVALMLLVLLLGLVLIRRQKDIEREQALKNKKEVVKQEVYIPSPTPTPLPGVYQLKISQENLKVNQDFTLDVFFSAPNKKISGADLRLKFDPDYLQAAEELVLGDYFGLYPRKEIDNKEGLVKVTAFQPKSKEELSGEPVKLLGINFTSVKAGASEIEVLSVRDKTNLSILVEQGTAKNILGTANSLMLKIEE